MQKYITFLRAINVGGHNVKMDVLREKFEEMGFTNVESFIASGNIIFDSEIEDTTTLKDKIEVHLEESLGYEVVTLIRTKSEVSAIAEYKPFSDAELESAGALNVAFLAAPLNGMAKAALARLKTGIDDFHVSGCEVYWLCKRKQSESTFSNAVFEKTLKVCATFRGIKTVRKLAVKYPAG